MTCLKCGRETDQTFCASCREVMEKYPVKPGTFVFHPREHKTVVKWKPVRLPSEALQKQIRVQKRQLQRLSIAVVVLAVIIGILGSVIFRLLQHRSDRPLGQNYSTIVQPVEDDTVPQTTEAPEPDPMFHVKR